MIESAVEINNLSWSIEAKPGLSLEILSGVSLEVHPEEFCSLIGPSGCGKSTILNFISGLRPIQNGDVRIWGNEVRGINPRVGYMFQRDALLPWLTAQDNVMLPGQVRRRSQRLSTSEIDAASRRLLKTVGLEGFERHFPRELSGGMRKRVQLARLLMQDPDIILLDEPFGSLDAQTRLLMHEELLRIWEESKRTVLFVTHDIQEALLLSDRIILMGRSPGRIIGDWNVDLPRPRDPIALVKDTKFSELFAEIWEALKAEIMRGQKVS